MAPLFFLTRSVTSSKTISASVDDALKVLHDTPEMIKLNPLVVGFTTSAQDQNTYTITDRFKILGLFSTETHYTAKFRLVEDGFNTDVQASAGTKLTNQWRARPAAENGQCVVEEQDQATAFFLLMPFVLSQLRSSHDTLLNGLAAKLEGNRSQEPEAESDQAALQGAD